MLGCDRLVLGYPGRGLCRDLNFAVRPGQCWALLGQNGSGKSTLLHALGGLRRPQAGQVSLQGKPLSGYARHYLAQQVGVLLQQEDSGFWGSVSEYVLLGRHPHRRSPFGWSAMDRAIVQRSLEQVDLQDFAQRTFDTLSGGERQRARAALLLAQQPQVYLLDEPLQGLDVRHQLQLLQLLRELVTVQGKSAVITLHDISWAAHYCDHALLMYGDGTSESGPVSELLTHSRLERLYRCRFDEFGEGAARHFLPRPSDSPGSV